MLSEELPWPEQAGSLSQAVGMTSQSWLQGTGTTSCTAEKHFLQRPPFTLEWKKAILVTHLNLYHARKNRGFFCPSLDNVSVNALPPNIAALLSSDAPFQQLSAACWCSPPALFGNSVCEWQLVSLGCDQPLIWQALAEDSNPKSQSSPSSKSARL